MRPAPARNRTKRHYIALNTNCDDIEEAASGLMPAERSCEQGALGPPRLQVLTHAFNPGGSAGACWPPDRLALMQGKPLGPGPPEVAAAPRGPRGPGPTNTHAPPCAHTHT